MRIHWLQFIVAGLAVCGVTYYLLCIWSVIAFWLEVSPRTASSFTPAVTILKPVNGIDPGADESFRSHCLQDYPEYEIIFGVGTLADSAVPLIERRTRRAVWVWVSNEPNICFRQPRTLK